VWLEQAYKERSNILQFVKTHPFFDPIRSDPRFVDLQRRIGLGSAKNSGRLLPQVGTEGK
jgi:hypothetical protein